MKTACIYHSVDLDGWMSAAIVKHWWQKEQGSYIQENNHITNPNTGEDSIDFIGYNYGQPIPDLTEYDKVIMCDISFPKEEMYKLIKKLNKNFIWIDHHISAINDCSLYLNDEFGLRDTKFAACELTWMYFFPDETMPEIVRLLGMYDSFRHKNTNEETIVLEFQYGARQCISNYEEAYRELEFSLRTDDNAFNIVHSILNKGKSIYQYLCTEAKQAYKNGFEIILEESLMLPDYRTKSRKFICFNKERFNPINFGIDYHKDGYTGAACFHYANGIWNFSLYNDNEEVDCSTIAKQYGGGGHKGASGFKLNNEEFLKLINGK